MAKEVGAQIILDPLIGDVNQAVEKILFEVRISKMINHLQSLLVVKQQ